MRKLENRKMVPMVEGGPVSTYVDMCRTAVNNVPREGFAVEEMRRRLRILDCLEAAKDKETIEVEDGDMVVLAQCVRDIRWIRLDKAIVDFVDYIQSIQAGAAAGA